MARSTVKLSQYLDWMRENLLGDCTVDLIGEPAGSHVVILGTPGRRRLSDLHPKRAVWVNGHFYDRPSYEKMMLTFHNCSKKIHSTKQHRRYELAIAKAMKDLAQKFADSPLDKKTSRRHHRRR
jgi:hypothetical protein